MTTRRVFMMQSVVGASALASGAVMAAAPMVAETDANAKALAYSADATKSKNAKYKAGSACENCALFQGKKGEAAGPCPLFAGKQVAVKGWCTAYAKKA
ncbi:MAG: high-potential iron-sulfur protein [Rhodoferax sp.]|nr:high-potential iron-sulfur protein [Rhodoferax sp.]